MFGQTTQINFQQTLAPLQGGRFSRNCPWDAVITSIMLHFPPGCNALVDVAIGHGNSQLCPTDGFVALDAATPVIPMRESVKSGEEFWVEIRNGDAINPHTISVILTLQRELE